MDYQNKKALAEIWLICHLSLFLCDHSLSLPFLSLSLWAWESKRGQRKTACWTGRVGLLIQKHQFISLYNVLTLWMCVCIRVRESSVFLHAHPLVYSCFTLCLKMNESWAIFNGKKSIKCTWNIYEYVINQISKFVKLIMWTLCADNQMHPMKHKKLFG